MQAIRTRAGSIIVKILFGLLIVSFGFWGIYTRSDYYQAHSPDTVVATVGDHSIRADELQRALQPMLERLRAQFGAAVDPRQVKQMGIVDTVLGQLIDRSLLDQEAERIGLEVSDDAVCSAIYDNPAFRGLSLLLAEHVPDPSSHSPLLDRVRSSRDTLTPAERRVADVVLGNPRSLLNDAIAIIAAQAEVSQPTVIRFCRSLGFEGLADFKLKLASGLTGTIPVLRSQVRRGEPTADLSAKVLDNTISAIVHFRESLNSAAIDRAITLLRGARRVEIFACGNSAVVALDAQHKLLRFRIPAISQCWTPSAAGKI